MAKLTNRLHVKQNDTVQEVVCYTTQEEATPGGGEHSCYELKNNNTTCYIPLWKKSVSGGNCHTPLTVKKNNTEYWVDTLVPQTVNLNYYARDNVTDYSRVTTLPQSNIDELTGIIAGPNASCAFYCCQELTTLNGVETTWDTSNITNMTFMFGTCEYLTSLNLSNWDTSNVSDMYGMFDGCTALTSLDLSNWDTSNASIMNRMFGNCSNLTTLDVSNWNTSNVVNIDHIFEVCLSLQYLIINSSTIKFVLDDFSNISLNNTCKILVPGNLISLYRANDGWSAYANQFEPIENYNITRSNGQVTVTPK